MGWHDVDDVVKINRLDIGRLTTTETLVAFALAQHNNEKRKECYGTNASGEPYELDPEPRLDEAIGLILQAESIRWPDPEEEGTPALLMNLLYMEAGAAVCQTVASANPQ